MPIRYQLIIRLHRRRARDAFIHRLTVRQILDEVSERSVGGERRTGVVGQRVPVRRGVRERVIERRPTTLKEMLQASARSHPANDPQPPRKTTQLLTFAHRKNRGASYEAALLCAQLGAGYQASER